MKFGTNIAEIGRLLVVCAAGFSLIVFVATSATNVGAAERVRGPLVVLLANKTCEFVPLGKTRSAKQVHAGAEPRNIVVKHNRSIGKQKFQIMLKFGISPSASSEVLCRYMALRMQGEKSEIVFRNQIVRLLSHLGTELLEEFSDPDNKKGQRAFEDFVHSKLGGYAQAHGLVTFTARFDRLTQ